MKKGQTSKRGGIEDILFPMQVCNVTQGDNVGTHKGTYATDNAGADTGISPLYAPVTMTLMAYDSARNGNAVCFQSDNKVRFADGTIDYLTMMFIHDNYIGDILKTKHYKQGQKFGDEGSTGYATGNHSHMEFAKGKYTHMYDQNKYGVYHLPNNIPIENACFMDGTTMKAGVADWKYLKDVKVEEKPSSSKKYFPKADTNETSLVDYMKEKCGYKTVAFADQQKIAKANGISDYTGTASQNVKLLDLAKKGKLVNPAGTTSKPSKPTTPKCNDILTVGSVVTSKAMKLAIPKGKTTAVDTINGDECIYVPELGGYFPTRFLSEADASDGKKDNYFANTNAKVYVDQCSVQKVNVAKNLVMIHGIWVDPTPLIEVKEGK